MTTDISSQIEAAFRKLHIGPDAESQLPVMVHALSLIPKGESGIAPPEFRLKGREAVRKDLQEIAALADKLAGALDVLCEPAIIALADGGLLQMQHREVAVVLGPNGERITDAKTYDLQAVLRKVSAIAASANLSDVPEVQGRGRPRNNLATGVADILAHDYWTLTGKTPAVATDPFSGERVGSFFELVEDVFQALRIEASPAAYAREAEISFKERIAQK
ncbi:hypothetical protein VOM14_05985 [Paraburkholderia sp. MPAMCS5]|uniref:hypothetical protein n=1 Tax=Paraburkholderia sp. MPAMCS5 TaxID=3112563 RepID=UPI002E179FA1|nr:hypothetical protein [Paraburkholderia sp. MPAMCS5]